MTFPHGRTEMSGSVAARYWEGMDRSMPAKLALVSGLLMLDKGATVLDAGCGSGAAAYHLARLNPWVRVIGIDLDPVAIHACQARYVLPNLAFVEGDAGKVFPEKVDAILSSSTMHHIHAFSRGTYSLDAVVEALANHAASLKDNGVLVLRDFVRPDQPATPIHLSLRCGEMAGSTETGSIGSVTELDEPGLLRKFAATARPLDRMRGPGFPMAELNADAGWRRFRLALGDAVEFLLRKDYRLDWDAELLEQYGYFTEEEFRQAFAGAGFADIRTQPIYNSWIIANRWQGSARLAAENGTEQDWPATNILVRGRIVPSGGHRIAWRRALDDPHYLEARHYQAQMVSANEHRETGHGSIEQSASTSVWTVIRRPQPAIEIIPYTIDADGIRILARDGQARPIVTAADNRHAGRIIEPLAYAGDLPEDPVSTLSDLGIDPALIDGDFEPLLSYLPSPGGLAELARTYAIRLRSLPVAGSPTGNIRDLTRPPLIRAIHAADILRAGQSGSLDEARLEIATASLLHRHHIAAAPWIADSLTLADDRPQAAESGTRQGRSGLAFAEVPAPGRPWMAIRHGLFQDLSHRGDVLAEKSLEWAEPSDGLPVTATLLLLRRRMNSSDPAPVIEIGLDWRILPAAQILTGTAEIPTLPAWRLAQRASTFQQAERALRQKAGRQLGNGITGLGGAYYASLGVSSERVFPFAADATQHPALASSLQFLPLDSLLADLGNLRDGHLLVSVLRAAQMLRSAPA